MRGLRIFVTGIVVGLAYAAISKELEKPPEARTWQGTIGVVPYNFRFSEWGDLVREYWNPESDQILSPKAIGIGWGINFAALTQRAQGWLQSTPEKPAAVAETAGE
jgi:hypothetical protein